MQCQGSEGLFQDLMDRYVKTLRLSPLVVEHSVVVMSTKLSPIGAFYTRETGN